MGTPEVDRQFTYELSDDLVRVATRRFFRHHINWRIPLAFAILLILLLLLCGPGEPGYLCGIFAGVILLLVVLVVIAYIVRNRQGEEFLRKLSSRNASCRVDDDGIHLENALGTSHLSWGMIEKVVRGSDVWLFFYGKRLHFPLPAQKIGAEMAQFIETKVRAADGRVTG